MCLQYTILDDGCVCMEFFRVSGGTATVLEVMRISANGLQVTVTHVFLLCFNDNFVSDVNLSLLSLISVQSTGRTRSSSLARPPVSSSLQITNRSFTYASPHLWNQLPSSFWQPHSVHSPPGSPHPAHITSSQSPPSLSSPVTPSTFHSRLKTHLFHKSFPP